MPETDEYKELTKQIDRLSAKFDAQGLQLTELRIAFASMKATVDAQAQTLHTETTNIKDTGKAVSDSTKMWMGVVFSLLAFLMGAAGLIYPLIRAASTKGP